MLSSDNNTIRKHKTDNIRLTASPSFKANITTKRSQSRILIVDDEPDNTLCFKRGLEANGFNVDTFSEPLLVLPKFKPDLYDLLLLDINMPHMNGLDLYQEIRKIDHKVKICFLTAFEVNPENLKWFLTLNTRIIQKPISMHDLIIEVEKELENNLR